MGLPIDEQNRPQSNPCPAELGSNLRTNLRTNVDFQQKMAPSKLLKTVSLSGDAP